MAKPGPRSRKPASDQSRKPASKPVSDQAGDRSRKPSRKPVSDQASDQSRKPASRPVSDQASGQAGRGSGDELRTRLVDATIRVLARDGFARTSARAVASEAGTVNGSVFYYFGSMDGLLAAAARAVGERGRERIRQGLGGDRAHLEWPTRLGAVMQAEVESDEGRAVMELFVGSRTSPALAAEVRTAIDEAIEYATTEMQAVIGDAPIARLVPVPLIAELAGAAFLGIELLAQNGRAIDVDQLAASLATALRLLGAPDTRR